MKKIISLALSAIMLIALFLPVSAIEIGTKDSGGSDVIAAYSSNVNAYVYEYNRWAYVINSYLYKNDDGGISRVECIGKRIFVEDYDSDYDFITGRQIEKELPIFGGFYSGTDYNYLVFGQNNLDKDDTVEVIRVVKYSKNWERLDSGSIYGGNTCYPFDAGSLRMLEHNGVLYVRTCHEMYNGHQSNMTVAYDIETSSATLNGAGYTSHSFNQFIVLDGDRIVTSDHGDAYPRGIVITRYTSPMREADEIVPMPFIGSTGNNDTGATLGGFESTAVGYMAAGNANLESLDRNAQRNIYLIVTPRDSFTVSSSRTIWLTNYDLEPDTVVNVSIPHLVKVNDDKLVVIWTEDGVVKYAFVNANGELLGDIVTDNDMRVSDCQPILDGDRVLWYVTSNTQPTFYYIYAGDAPAPEATPVPAPAGPIEGELIVDKQVRLEEDGTYSIIYSAYSTGTEHTNRTWFYENTIRIFDKTAGYGYKAEYEECLGKINGEYVFVPTSDNPGSLFSSSSSSSSSFSYQISGFAFNKNICYPYGGGYKFILTVYGLKLKDDLAPGTYNISGSSYVSCSGLPRINLPQYTITIGSKDIAYDFGTELVYGEDSDIEVLSIDSGYGKYAAQDGGYAYNLALPTPPPTPDPNASESPDDPTNTPEPPAYAAAVSDGKVGFEPQVVNSSKQSFNALVKHADGSSEWTRLNFLPATTVHYEDDFASYDSGDYGNGSYAEWSACGTPVDAYQSGENTLYGYDASYASQQGDGNGSAMKVTVDKALFEQVKKPNSGAAWPKAEFTFTGTGVDIIGRVGADTGAVLAKIVSNGIDGQSAVSKIIDTYYPGVYGDVLYQCPIVHVTGLKYGEYTVTLTPIYMPGYDHQSVATSAPDAETNGGEYVRNIPGLPEGEYELVRLFDGAAETTRGYGEFNFYFDGFRVYDPLGNSSAQSAYLEAGEYKPIYKSVKKLVQSQADSDEGALFFMLDDENNRVSSTDYVDVNFNTELYALAQGGAAFKIEGSYERVQISLRAPAGKTVVYSINGHEFTISHTAELYYDITDLIGSDKRVAVTCLESGSDQGAVLSIVNIKLTSENPTKNGSGAEPRIVWDEELIEFVEAMYFGVMGDADHDGSVTVMDALTVMRSVLGSVQLGTYGSICADVDNDGIISVLDALAIIRIALAIE